MHLYLQDDLWNEIYIYDAGHYVMLPMHVAFWANEDAWVNDIRDLMKRSVENLGDISDLPSSSGLLNWLQYAYLMSRYITLEQAEPDLIVTLASYLDQEVHRIWSKYPAWMWSREPFPNMRERVEWKLNCTDPQYSYYRCIFDQEIFVFAIAADLIFYDFSHNGVLTHVDTHRQISEYAYRVFVDRVSYTNENAWVFQPGVWTDHGDYAYAGQRDKGTNLVKKPVPGIAEDSSHAHRMPLWLVSLRSIYQKDDEEYAYYDNLINGLGKQVVDNVLSYPTESFGGIRMTNYMDGSNGLYRWQYITAGNDDGYGPYELSATFLLGWWSFTNNNTIKGAYKQMIDLYPLSDAVIKTYVGPNTTRERNPWIDVPDSLNKGLYELICRLAAIDY